MDRSTPAARPTAAPSRPLLFRASAIAAACLLLTLQSRQLQAADVGPGLLLFLLLFLSRSAPVVLAREKPITFTAAFVFAAALLLNGVAAGWSALIVCALHSRLLQRGGRLYALFLGAQYALAALAAHGTFALVSGRASVTPPPGLRDFLGVCTAAFAFMAVNGLLVGLGNLGTRYARRRHAEPVFRVQALAYAVSFPFAALMVFAYRAIGWPALPCLAALLLACAHAVRLTVENRLLARQLAAVEELGDTCASGVRVEMPLQRFLALAHKLVAFEQAVLWMADETSADLRARAVYPEDASLPAAPLGPETTLARAAQRPKPILLADTRRLGTPLQSWMLYPILLHGRSIGVAQFIRSAARPFTRPELARLESLVPQAAIAFESVRVRHLMHRYADMAITDGLTGLLNHRRSHEALRDEFGRAVRYARPLSILMLDVDGFKQFNDTFGHPQGDILLQAIARILRADVRSVDHVGRYGGEEFIILLPETGRADACVLAERIRAAVEAEWFPVGNGEAVRKTISIGVASYPDDATQPTELVQHADDALYRAKRLGKNRVLTA